MGKVPKVPNQIMGMKVTDIPYYANYDRFDKCGKNIVTIVTYIVQYCCNDVDRIDELPNLFLDNADYAKKSYQFIQNTKSR